MAVQQRKTLPVWKIDIYFTRRRSNLNGCHVNKSSKAISIGLGNIKWNRWNAQVVVHLFYFVNSSSTSTGVGSTQATTDIVLNERK